MQKTYSTFRIDSVIIWLLIMTLLVLASCLPALAQPFPLIPKGIQDFDTCQVLITRVVDGDTFICERNGEIAKVRVLGFDAYETRKGSRLDRQAERSKMTSDSAIQIGWKGREEAKQILAGKTLLIHRGDGKAPNRDIFGRFLRYVIVNNEDFAEIMIRRGYAAPNIR